MRLLRVLSLKCPSGCPDWSFEEWIDDKPKVSDTPSPTYAVRRIAVAGEAVAPAPRKSGEVSKQHRNRRRLNGVQIRRSED